MKVAIDCYGFALIGCRKLEKVLQVFLKGTTQKAPHHTTIRNWIWRNGYAILNSPKETADDWIAIGDLTVSLGKMKLLAIIGVRAAAIKNKPDLTLSHKDVQVLELAPCERSNGEFVNKTFSDAMKRIDNPFRAIIIDRGTDIKKGATLFQESHPETKIIHDISHKLSNVLEKILKDDPTWIAYNKELTLTRHRVQQSEFAALMPPVQRRDARFMDISDIVFWPDRILKAKDNGNLKDISANRFEEYLGWMRKYKESLIEWETIVQAGEMIKEITRECWLSKEIYAYIKTAFEEFQIKGSKIKLFIDDSLKAVLEEVEKLGDDEIMLCSTEVLESIFGKYKAINAGSEQGISGNVLAICSFVSSEKTEEQILINMEQCSTKTMNTWVVKKVGDTLGKLRKKFFKKSRTKFDKIFKDQNAA